MTTPQVLMTKARIATFLARIKASKAAKAQRCMAMDQAVPTTIRYQRRAGQEQRV